MSAALLQEVWAEAPDEEEDDPEGGAEAGGAIEDLGGGLAVGYRGSEERPE